MNWISKNLTLIAIIGVAVLLLVALGAIRSCSERGKEAAQAEQNAKSSDAYAGAAKNAVETVVERAKSDTDVDTLVAAATLEIENAENPGAARLAVIDAVCKLRTYRSRPECALLNDDTGNVAKAR